LILRFLLFVGLAYLGLYLIRLLLSWRRQRNLRSHDNLTKAEEMVLDPQCGSYLPKGEAISRGGHYFCSEECARLYLSKG